MSTRFYTEPPIPYNELLKSKSLVITDPERAVHTVDHKLMTAPDCKGTLFVFQADDGSARFERFGSQNPMILGAVAEDFGVQIFDEYGLKWPEESGG